MKKMEMYRNKHTGRNGRGHLCTSITYIILYYIHIHTQFNFSLFPILFLYLNELEFSNAKRGRLYTQILVMYTFVYYPYLSLDIHVQILCILSCYCFPCRSVAMAFVDIVSMKVFEFYKILE